MRRAGFYEANVTKICKESTSCIIVVRTERSSSSGIRVLFLQQLGLNTQTDQRKGKREGQGIRKEKEE
ncbi:hypothetical protein EYF80_043458 [Liparis tanakae]|uniref:Uncharacterized protein n=1 Tax=Liparis tanakae TaxID=230148 RepID=A0A4Z2FZM7_9TELE|nr:hypothetical protein EYF80_043458 [Liparis tanakae]